MLSVLRRRTSLITSAPAPDTGPSVDVSAPRRPAATEPVTGQPSSPPQSVGQAAVAGNTVDRGATQRTVRDLRLDELPFGWATDIRSRIARTLDIRPEDTDAVVLSHPVPPAETFPPGWHPGRCYHPVHIELVGYRYGVLPLDSETDPTRAALQRCANVNPDGC